MAAKWERAVGQPTSVTRGVGVGDVLSLLLGCTPYHLPHQLELVGTDAVPYVTRSFFSSPRFPHLSRVGSNLVGRVGLGKGDPTRPVRF